MTTQTTPVTGVIPELTLGQRLRISLEHADMSPESMALALHCNATTVRNYLSGRTKIRWPELVLWAEVTGVDREWLSTSSHDDVTRASSGAVTSNPQASGDMSFQHGHGGRHLRVA